MNALFRSFLSIAVALSVSMVTSPHLAAAPARTPRTPVRTPITPPVRTGASLLLPSEIPAVPGREVNVYFDNVFLSPTAGLYNFEVESAKGTHLSERFTWTPTDADVGTLAVTISVFDLADQKVAGGMTTIHVYPADAGNGQSISMLAVGASETNASVYTAELLKLFGKPGNPTFSLIGTRVPTTDPANRHEGYGGWKAESFMTRWNEETEDGDAKARSPFLFDVKGSPSLDFQRYCDAANEGRAPDYITILLGGNDTAKAVDTTIDATIAESLTYMEALIQEFHRVRADTRIGVVTMMPPASSQDGFGANYGCGLSRWQYRKNQQRMIEWEYANFAGREDENVFLIPAYQNLDCAANYPTSMVPVNARNEGVISRQDNALHPTKAGYRQMADSIYSWLKGMTTR